jgi:hypothetical protein
VFLVGIHEEEEDGKGPHVIESTHTNNNKRHTKNDKCEWPPNNMHRRSYLHVTTVHVAAAALLWLATAAATTRQHPRSQRFFLPHGAVKTTPAVAVCLYGPAAGMLAMTRSSIWAHLLDVLAYQGWHADVYVHVYAPWSEAAPRSVACASNASISSKVGDVSMAAIAPWRLLDPVQEEVVDDDQSTSSSHADDKDARLAASLAAVTRMWQSKAAGTGQYRAIIYAR